MAIVKNAVWLCVFASCLDAPALPEEESSVRSVASTLQLTALTPAGVSALPPIAKSRATAAQIRSTIADFDADGRPDILHWTATTITIDFANGHVYRVDAPDPTTTISKVVPVEHGARNAVSLLVSVYRKTTEFYARAPQLMLVNDGTGHFVVETLALELMGRDVTCTKVPTNLSRGLCMFASYGNHDKTYSTLVEITEAGGIVDVTQSKGLPWRGASGTPVAPGNQVDGKFMMGFAFVDLNGDGLPDLVGTGQHSRIMYAFMLRDGASYRFGPAAWFENRDEYVGVASLGKTSYNFPCVYVQVEDGDGHVALNDFLTCFDPATRTWTHRALPLVTTTGETIERYVAGVVEPKLIDASDAIYISTRARLVGGTVTNIVVRAVEAAGAPALVPAALRSEVFDASAYAGFYPDLQAAFGASADKLAHHWLTAGMAAGRRASPTFWSKAYLERYPDLRAAFGTDYAMAIGHYIAHGLAEGRAGI